MGLKGNPLVETPNPFWKICPKKKGGEPIKREYLPFPLNVFWGEKGGLKKKVIIGPG